MIRKSDLLKRIECLEKNLTLTSQNASKKIYGIKLDLLLKEYWLELKRDIHSISLRQWKKLIHTFPAVFYPAHTDETLYTEIKKMIDAPTIKKI